MISSLNGKVLTVAPTFAVIEVGGFGLKVLATPSVLADLREGESARLATSFVVREDSMTLYGFHDDDERDTYETLQSVSGVGPKVALALLSVMTPNELRRAIEMKDEAALMRVPGIGKKSAQRLILELAGKLGPAVGSEPASGSAPASNSDVIEALVGLGWPERNAASAYQEAVEANPQAGMPELLRTSLQLLGRR
ncbi:holliday junction DNA helicase RuvA [Actinobaculum suis]|uniref:Holliday junction branch migration complex subunit RuvA n=1 Tax=Actinobaculum suis TaxID=1657 RepID=A0A1G7BJV3_9ACTO|nr:Holliday junction branch migration protein RuvA [Actinobaculum suis]MDY5153742.1 Holliday junction branch migration protein RuvA [Actinobaculum suis]SDE27217.1 holliday junction DNA helicase RuvA [Actinobaculum suis]